MERLYDSDNNKNFEDTLPYDEKQMNALLKNIGISIKRERMKQNKSLRDLSIISNVSESTLRKIESGFSNPTISNVLSICYGLNLMPDDVAPLVLDKKIKSNGDYFNTITKYLSDEEIKEIFEVVKTMSIYKSKSKKVKGGI